MPSHTRIATPTAAWLSRRQQADGGVNGREGKASDTCYAWWVTACAHILGSVDNRYCGTYHSVKASQLPRCDRQQAAGGVPALKPGQGRRILSPHRRACRACHNTAAIHSHSPPRTCTTRTSRCWHCRCWGSVAWAQSTPSSRCQSEICLEEKRKKSFRDFRRLGNIARRASSLTHL